MAEWVSVTILITGVNILAKDAVSFLPPLFETRFSFLLFRVRISKNQEKRVYFHRNSGKTGIFFLTQELFSSPFVQKAV